MFGFLMTGDKIQFVFLVEVNPNKMIQKGE